MLQAKDLRLGNLIQCQFEPGGEWMLIEIVGTKVLSNGLSLIWWKGPNGDPDDMVLLSEGYKGIPLTPEWLKNCDLWWQDELLHTAKGGIVFKSNEDETSFWLTHTGLTWASGYEAIGEPIRYVHQLQNLYFDLTGEELTKNY